MFVPMRRSKQQLPADKCAAILRGATAGVLGTAGTDGYPYAVPVSFAYVPSSEDDAASDAVRGRIFLHCATTGHKLDALDAAFSSPTASAASLPLAPHAAQKATRKRKASGPWGRNTPRDLMPSSPTR